MIRTYPIGQSKKAVSCSRRCRLFKFPQNNKFFQSLTKYILLNFPKKKHVPPLSCHRTQILPSNSHKILMLCNALDRKGFISGMWGRKGGEKNAQMMLFWSYLVRMAVFPSDIREPAKCHVSVCCCLDAIKGTTLRWERRSYAHLLTRCYCCWFFF